MRRALLSLLLAIQPAFGWANGPRYTGPSQGLQPGGQWSVGLPAAPEDEWEAMYGRVAEKYDSDVETVRSAARAMEKAAGLPFKSFATAKQIERQFHLPEFKAKYLEPAAYARERPEAGAQANRIVALSREYRVTPGEVETLLRTHVNETQARYALDRIEARRMLQAWPDNLQRAFVGSLLADIRARSGDSIEEITRSGAFAYVRMSGNTILRVATGRDPDFKGCDASFYITHSHGRFEISLYPSVAAPSGALEAFRRWLLLGLPGIRL